MWDSKGSGLVTVRGQVSLKTTLKHLSICPRSVQYQRLQAALLPNGTPTSRSKDSESTELMFEFYSMITTPLLAC